MDFKIQSLTFLAAISVKQTELQTVLCLLKLHRCDGTTLRVSLKLIQSFMRCFANATHTQTQSYKMKNNKSFM